MKELMDVLANPATEKAIDLALEFKRHCIEHGLPLGLAIDDIAYGADAYAKNDRGDEALLRQALEALEASTYVGGRHRDTIAALRERLGEQ